MITLGRAIDATKDEQISSSSVVARSFGQAVKTYDQNALVQREAALLLAHELQRICSILPDGRVLELGCGTGLFTEEILRLLPEQTSKLITDLAPEMVDLCRSRFRAPALEFATVDCDSYSMPRQFGLIASAFAAQWFKEICTTFDGIYESLIPGGYFLFSLPTNDSFPEWKLACFEAGLPFTGNELPDANLIFEYCRERFDSGELRTAKIPTHFSSAMDFFRSLKNVGAIARLSGMNSDKQNLRRLARAWEDQRKSRRDAGAPGFANSSSDENCNRSTIAQRNAGSAGVPPASNKPGSAGFQPASITETCDITVTYDVLYGFVRRAK